MEFLNQHVGEIVAAALVLLALLVVLGVWRAFGPKMAGRRGQRLGISEYLELDKTRRLVLVRRDNIEHLILIGGGQDVVVEPAITASGIASNYSTFPAHAEPPMPPPVAPVPPSQPAAGSARPAPRPPTFSERKPTLRPAGEPAPLRSAREEPEL